MKSRAVIEDDPVLFVRNQKKNKTKKSVYLWNRTDESCCKRQLDVDGKWGRSRENRFAY